MKRKPYNRRELSLHNLLAKNSPFSWRALFAFFVTLLVSTPLLIFGKLGETQWVELVQWIGGFFIAGETVKKFAKGSAEETGEAAPGSGGKGEGESNLQ
jgi:hypothetical protein